MTKRNTKYFVGITDDSNCRSILELKAKNRKSAEKEVKFLLDTGTITEPVIMDYDALATFYRDIGDALGYYATVNWTVEDVMALKKCSRARATEWLSCNGDQLSDRMTECGWDVVNCLWNL